MKTLSKIILAVTVWSSTSMALIEARLTYGMLASKQKIADLCVGCAVPANAPDIVPTYGLGADLIVSPPLIDWGFGIRYENLGLSASSNGIDAKVTNTRTAILVNYRILNTLAYVGPIFTYGVSHSGNFEIKENGILRADYNAGSASSYSLGFEAGAKLIGFLVGGELGYQDLRWKDAKSTVGTGSTQDINLSGTYAKIHLGFGF